MKNAVRKGLSLVFVAFCFNQTIAQNTLPTSDSLNNSQKDNHIKKLNNNILNPEWTKNNYILDFNLISFTPDYGALGFRYLRSVNWNYQLKYGARIGIWGRKSGTDVPQLQRKNYINYSFSLLASFPIWKLLNLETSACYFNDIFWPQKNNTYDQKGFHNGYAYYGQKIGLSMIFMAHFCLDAGVRFDYDFTSHYWHENFFLTIGYKF